MDPYFILSLDGGGIRGVLTAVLLEKLEMAVPGFLGKVDLFAGTSTGAILALGLAHGLSPTEARQLYEEKGDDIFANSYLDDLLDVGFARGARYSNDNLEAELQGIFGDQTLGDLSRNVLISSFDLENDIPNSPHPHMWKAKFFHNYGSDELDMAASIVDVALRSAAAPTYFPVYQGYVDGGIVANNPSMCALAQAKAEGVELDEIVLLSVGTGLNLRHLPQQDADWGWIQWVFQIRPLQNPPYESPLIDAMLEGSVGLADYQCQQLLGDNYRRLDPELPQVIPLDAVDQIPLLLNTAEDTEIDRAITWLKAQFKNEDLATAASG